MAEEKTSDKPTTRLSWGEIAGIWVIVALVVFAFRDFLAECVGYAATMDGGMNRGARFFRDFMVGFAALTGIVIATWRTAAFDRQSKTAADELQLTRVRLLDDRFAFAAELMMKTVENIPAITERVSGIHIMGELAFKNPTDFAERVVKSLIAYIGDNAQRTAMPPKEGGGIPVKPRILGADVMSAFRVLNGMLIDTVIREKIADHILDFSYRDFSGLNLNLEHVSLHHYKRWIGADFRGADLRKAHFINEAILRGAKFQGAKLQGAHFLDVNLRDARLNTDLSHAFINNADLSGADLRGARLVGTYMGEAILSCVQAQGAILHATFGTGTTLDAFYGATVMTDAHIQVSLSDSVKQSMEGQIWHLEDNWAEGIAEYPQTPELQLQQLKQWDCYALAGVVRNLEQFNHLDGADDILKQARELLREEGKIPGECRGLIAQMQSGAAEEDD